MPQRVFPHRGHRVRIDHLGVDIGYGLGSAGSRGATLIAGAAIRVLLTAQHAVPPLGGALGAETAGEADLIAGAVIGWCDGGIERILGAGVADGGEEAGGKRPDAHRFIGAGPHVAALDGAVPVKLGRQADAIAQRAAINIGGARGADLISAACGEQQA